jgi:predicted metal-dependent hydrolase
MTSPHPIVPREKLDFGLDGDIPKHWFGGDAFKSRYFDAMSTLFPEGERFFITSVRHYRAEVTDPELLCDIRDFIRQEGQHGIVHTRYNERLKAQGINVDKLEAFLRYLFGTLAQKFAPRIQNLADTAATEHLTAIMAECLFANKAVMGQADARIRAIYAWHAIEEVEHKAVAFDVMQKVAKCSYVRRVVSLLGVSFGFSLYALVVTNYMLKVDGQGLWQRALTMARGFWWLYKPGGLYAPIMRHYVQYFRPSFHPWKHGGELRGYKAWLSTFEQTHDPVQAGEVLYAVGE